MLGLFGALNVAQRSMQTQQQGLEIVGQNLSNVNNPAYARQRLTLQTATPIPTGIGPEGTGVEATSIQQLRNSILDTEIQNETSTSSYTTALQDNLNYAQAVLGQQIQSSTSSYGATSSTDTNATSGIGGGLTDFFNAWQSLSTDPTSVTERQIVTSKAQELTSRFNQIDTRLSDLQKTMSDSVQIDVGSANNDLTSIAKLNDQIASLELSTGGRANDLRDARQAKLEDLAKFVNLTSQEQSDGTVNVSIGGELFIDKSGQLDSLTVADPAANHMYVVRTVNNPATNLPLTSGSIQGTLDTRDGAVQTLRDNINTLATQLITQVNQLHITGFNLNGVNNPAATFFTGTGSANIAVNAALVNDPKLIQASGTGSTGDNQIALTIARLSEATTNGASGNQTFSQFYGSTVSTLGTAIAQANSQNDDQTVIQKMLLQQRDSYSGVSTDEEVSNMLTYQRAYQASAHLISTIDSMLNDLMSIQ